MLGFELDNSWLEIHIPCKTLNHYVGQSVNSLFQLTKLYHKITIYSNSIPNIGFLIIVF